MNLIEHIKSVEKLLDDANGEWGYEKAFCLFCDSTQVSSHVGIVHTDTCPVMQLRIIIQQEEVPTDKGKEQET